MSKKNYYFGEEEEQAVLDYQDADEEERSKIFENRLNDPFEEMIQQIVYTYKFADLPNVDQLQEECKSHLITILPKYKREYDTKAFSYFTISVRNWFYGKTKKRRKKLTSEVTYADIPKHYESELVIEHEYEKTRIQKEYVEAIKEEIDTWDKGRRGRLLGKNDLLVVKSLKDMLDRTENIDIFNKKGLYVYIRENTDLNTKQITRSINKLRPRYQKFNKKWLAGKI